MDNLQSAILSRFTNALPTPIRLRDLIRQIRAARTAAEERAVVQKECAYIRSTFREDDNLWRCRNVAKLLYIHMLGYPAHFGQLECLKLIASTRYTDKRIGYLGAMLLLDERQDVHLLITNSLKNDLNSQHQFVVGLALCCLGAICSAEMSRDLLEEVERLMKSTNTYVKKKAALCAARMIRKLPDLCEMFLPVAKNYLSDKNHGCIITGVTLITEMCEQNADALHYYKKGNEFVSSLVKILKNLIMSGYSPEHDVSGVSDPFLQIAILRLLRILGRNDEVTSEIMNDILAQVATNTEGNKNVGNAILYETVISIMEIKSEGSLRVLGVNILGRFLLNTDKNIRYVALTTLSKTVQADYNAVQRHRTTIVDCLKDPDISIRKKALELCFALINENNVKTMSKELILFLEKADSEFKSTCSSSLCISAEKYAPDSKWHLDTVIKILKTSGNNVRDDIVSMLIELISSVESLHIYSVCQLWPQLINDLAAKQPLVQVTMWAVGEYGDLLVQSSGTPELNHESVTQSDLIDKCEQVLTTNQMTLITKEYTLNALIKLSVRFPEMSSRAKQIVDLFGVSHSIELQQRAVEFSILFQRHDQLRPSVLEKMPPMEKKERKVDSESEQNGNHIETEVNGGLDKALNDASSSALLDLLNLSTPTESLPTKTFPSNEINANVANDVLDLLGSLDIGGPVLSNANPLASLETTVNTTLKSNPLESFFNSVSSAPVITTTFSADLSQPKLLTGLNGTTSNLLDGSLLDIDNSSGLNDLDEVQPKKNSIPSITSYDKNGLKIDFTFERALDNVQMLVISMVAQNSTMFPMEEFLFQAAVPKSFQLQLMPPTGSTIPANLGGSVSQLIKVVNPNKNQLKMRLRLSYKHNGQSVLEQSDVTEFPIQTWQ